MAVSDASQRDNLVNTFSSARRFTGVPDTRLPLRQRRSAHVALVLAWVAFWLNSALVPCCEAFAAAFDDHTDEVSQSVTAAKQAHHAGETQSEKPHRSPDSPCDYTFDTQPPISGVYAGLPTDRVDLEWVATSAPFANSLTALNLPANLAQRDYHPPPPFRLYLHTQRLLI